MSCAQWLYGGANGDLLHEAYATHWVIQVCCSQSLFPQQTTADPYLCTRHSNNQRQVWLSLCGRDVWVSVGTRFCLSPPNISGKLWGLILNAILPLLPSYLGFSFAFGIGISFFWWTPTFSCPWLFSS